MTVTSRELTEPKIIRTSRYDLGSVAGAFVGFTFGAVVWIFGARYTIDGVILACNTVLAFLSIPAHIRVFWQLYLYLAFIPLLFSAVEWTCSPVGKQRVKHPGLIAAWFIVITLDVFSTLLGLATATSPAALVAVVSNMYGIGVLSIVLTFGPEALMKSCGRLIWRAVKALFA